MKTLARLSTLTIAVMLSLAVVASEKTTKVTYKWVDENGITQFTERPPKDRAYEKIIVTSSGGQEVTEVTADEASEQANEEVVDPIAEIQAANDRNCKIARQNMDVLNNISRIRVTEDGQERILSPEEKADRIKDTQKQIDTFCKPAQAPAS